MNDIRIKLEKKGGYYLESDKENNCIYSNSVFIKTEDMNQKEYQEFEDICDKAVINRTKYSIFTCYDASGFDYWNDPENGSNYISLTISINKHFDATMTDKDIERLYQDIETLIDNLSVFDGEMSGYDVRECLLM